MDVTKVGAHTHTPFFDASVAAARLPLFDVVHALIDSHDRDI